MTVAEATGCQHLEHIVHEIQQSIDPLTCRGVEPLPAAEKESFVNAVARRNVSRVVERCSEQSQTLDDLVREGRIAIVGAMYDVATGDIEFLPDPAANPCERSIDAIAPASSLGIADEGRRRGRGVPIVG